MHRPSIPTSFLSLVVLALGVAVASGEAHAQEATARSLKEGAVVDLLAMQDKLFPGGPVEGVGRPPRANHQLVVAESRGPADLT